MRLRAASSFRKCPRGGTTDRLPALRAFLSLRADLAFGGERWFTVRVAGEAPSVGSFPNAPGMVTITWDHGGDGVFWFVVESESPGAFMIADRDKRIWSVTGLQPAHTYRFRVCAVFEFDRSCSDWTTVTTLPTPAEETPVVTPPPPEASPLLPAFVGSFEPL